MRILRLAAACAVIILTFAATATRGASTSSAYVDFSDLGKKEKVRDTAMGINVRPTGPTDLPTILSGWEVVGATDAFLENTVTSRFYSGSSTFSDPISEITIDVKRANNSGWSNYFTLTGYDDGIRVGTQSVNLEPVGDWTRITLSAPSIDKITWHGTNWILQPYYVSGFRVNFVPEAGIGTGTTGPGENVGAAVPEPGGLGILGISLLGGLLRPRRDRRVIP